jgi:hypothetical protein
MARRQDQQRLGSALAQPPVRLEHDLLLAGVRAACHPDRAPGSVARAQRAPRCDSRAAACDRI